MPLRRKENKPSKHVTLKEALNWIAFDNFGGPELTDNEVQIGIFGDCDNLEAIEIAQWQRSQSLDEAKDELFSALRDGDIEARGFRGTQWTTGALWFWSHPRRLVDATRGVSMACA